MELVFQPNQEYVITLKEITDLIGTRHNDAMKKVEELANEEDFGQLREIRICIPKGNNATQEIDTYQFTKKQAIAVGARLNNTMLMKVINRLEELESKNKPAVPQTYKEALLALIEKEEALERAIATKAEIGSRREATAMNTASQAVKRANDLEIQLDKAKQYATVKKMEQHFKRKFQWQPLKKASVDMGYEIQKVFDANYENGINSYHIDVWLEVYGVWID